MPECVIDLRQDVLGDSVGQFQRLVVLDDAVFDEPRWQVWQVALAVEASHADEVGVGASGAFGFGADEFPAACRGAAARAVKVLLEVVEVRRSRRVGADRSASTVATWLNSSGSTSGSCRPWISSPLYFTMPM